MVKNDHNKAMAYFSVAEAKAKLSDLIAMAERGDEVIIPATASPSSISRTSTGLDRERAPLREHTGIPLYRVPSDSVNQPAAG